MFDSSLAYRGFLRIERTITAALEMPMTYTTLQYEGNPQCRACGRTHWSRNSACCECDTACCDLCAAVLPNDELVCFRCARTWFHCENCGSTRQTVLRDAELIAEQQGFPVSHLPACCEASHA